MNRFEQMNSNGKSAIPRMASQGVLLSATLSSTALSSPTNNVPHLFFQRGRWPDLPRHFLGYAPIIAKKEAIQMEIRCPNCRCVFVRDYSKEVEQSRSKAVSVQTRCPRCNRPLYFIVTPAGVTYLKTHAELLWTYELLFGVRSA
jgi:hypothetical protein